MSKGYKMTELGELPHEWSVYSLDEIKEDGTSISYGVVQPGQEVTGGVLFIRGGDVKNGKIRTELRTISQHVSDQYKRTILKGGELLVSLVGYPGECAIVPQHLAGANIARQVGIIRIKKSVSASYLQQYLASPIGKRNLLGNLVGSAQQVINLDMLRKVKIPLPTKNEQQKIAEIFNTVDEKIDVIDAQITQTQELKKGLMQKLLTRGIGHTQFKSSPLGEIPECWKVVKLSDVSTFSNGKGHEQFIDENGKYIVVNSKFISTEGEVKKFSNKNLCPLHRGEITMVMSDIPNGKAIAKCFIVDADDKYTLNQRICSLKVKPGVDTRFLYYVVNRNPYYLAFDNGVSQTNLKKEEVTSCPVQLPPLDEQRKISSLLKTFDAKIQTLGEKKFLFTELKRGLMQQLLTGKLRVNHLIPEHATTKPANIRTTVEC